LAIHLGVNPPELGKTRQAKRDERGGFDGKIFLIESEINEEKGINPLWFLSPTTIGKPKAQRWQRTDYQDIAWF
jgi:hypothetical protein